MLGGGEGPSVADITFVTPFPCLQNRIVGDHVCRKDPLMRRTRLQFEGMVVYPCAEQALSLPSFSNGLLVLSFTLRVVFPSRESNGKGHMRQP